MVDIFWASEGQHTVQEAQRSQEKHGRVKNNRKKREEKHSKGTKNSEKVLGSNAGL